LIYPILFPGAPQRRPTAYLTSSVSGCAPAKPPDFPILFLSPGAPRRSPTPDFPLCPRVRPGAALHLFFPLLSPGAPRSSPTPSFASSVSGCAPAQPYT
ncbi:hypothetical protein CDAR_520041, partial [Caerostris darwini]